MKQEKIELERIEQENTTWKNQFMKEQSIWDYIAMQINSHAGEKKKYWCRVMDLYHKKYRF